MATTKKTTKATVSKKETVAKKIETVETRAEEIPEVVEKKSGKIEIVKIKMLRTYISSSRLFLNGLVYEMPSDEAEKFLANKEAELC